MGWVVCSNAVMESRDTVLIIGNGYLRKGQNRSQNDKTKHENRKTECETQIDVDASIQSLGYQDADEIVEDVLLDPDSMLDDEIMSMSEGDDDYNKVLSP
ncbi:hypothetical protein Tco_0841215 [Tanacetum coccineum]|uniref:Uncharacterized protein n=1 Tax=Tanacetum coccineum TaxID=301880 RepID=A0ABQ5AZN5_9ASTR